MMLQWEERDKLGNVITQTNPILSLENVHTYAKRNHRKCNGTGLERWDNGWQYYLRESTEDEKDYLGEGIHQIMDRRPINPRIYACDCVLKTLSITGV